MPSQRRRPGAFAALALGMSSLGLAVGLTFPVVAPLMGVARADAASLRFRLACLFAGGVVGLASWLLARLVVGRRLRDLANEMGSVASLLRSQATNDQATEDAPLQHAIAVTSRDGLGRTARAFNELLAAVEDEQRFRSLVQAASDVICLVEGDGTIAFASSSVEQVLGWSPDRVRGQHLASTLHREDHDVLDQLLADDWERGEQLARPVRIAHADGSWRHLEIGLSDRRDDPDVGAIVVTARDVTQRHELQRRLEHQANHDALTGLPNRSALRHAADGLLAGRAGRAGVVVLDLDGFKDVNDTLGHAYGDRLLVLVGERLAAAVRDDDLLARLGGDEFAVLMPDASADAAVAAGERLAAALDGPFELDGIAVEIEASIGVAACEPEHACDDVDVLLRNADIAMYAAKELRTRVELYSPEDDNQGRSRLVLLADFRRALAEDQLELVYQPKVSLTRGGLVGVEALVRWRHPERGLLTPDAFLPVVEQTGLIDAMTDATIDLALRQARRWLDDGHHIQVAVNLSARCLRDVELPDRVEALLGTHAVAAELLRLELTESALIVDPARAMEVIRRLHDLGVTFSIDDFGTGYSSMGYLRRLPVDELKIDRGFVAAMLGSPEDHALVRSVIDLGHNLGLEVVAEGIEDASTTDALGELRCDVGQGYHFARPLGAEQLDAWLEASEALAERHDAA